MTSQKGEVHGFDLSIHGILSQWLLFIYIAQRVRKRVT